MLSSVWLDSCGWGMGRHCKKQRRPTKLFIRINGEVSCNHGAHVSTEHEKTSHLAKPAVLFLVQSMSFSLYSALFLFIRQYLLFIFKPPVLREMESSQKTFRCPWKCCQTPEGGCGALCLCCWITRTAHGLGTHRQMCPASGHAQRTWKAQGDPLCMQASHHTSKTLWLLGIYSVMTVACPMCCHKTPAYSISPWPTYPGRYVTCVPKRTIMVNVKWSIVRIWTSYTSNSASIWTCKWNSWMEFGEILLGNVTIFSRNLSSYSDLVIQFRYFKTSYLICSLEDFTFIIHLLMALKNS